MCIRCNAAISLHCIERVAMSCASDVMQLSVHTVQNEWQCRVHQM